MAKKKKGKCRRQKRPRAQPEVSKNTEAGLRYSVRAITLSVISTVLGGLLVWYVITAYNQRLLIRPLTQEIGENLRIIQRRIIILEEGPLIGKEPENPTERALKRITRSKSFKLKSDFYTANKVEVSRLDSNAQIRTFYDVFPAIKKHECIERALLATKFVFEQLTSSRLDAQGTIMGLVSHNAALLVFGENVFRELSNTEPPTRKRAGRSTTAATAEIRESARVGIIPEIRAAKERIDSWGNWIGETESAVAAKMPLEVQDAIHECEERD